MATSVSELVAFDSKSAKFITQHVPLKMGNAANIAYGGCAIAFAVNVASSTVQTDTHRLYSALGHFLSAALADRVLQAVVTPIRDTRGFATRNVLVTQALDNGEHRSVLSVTLDFHRIEPASLLNYSVPLPAQACPAAEAWDRSRARAEMLQLQGSSEKHVQLFEKTFEPAFRFFDARSVPDSVSTQNMYGVVKRAPTSQDHLPLTDKSSLDWTRSKVKLSGHAEQISTIAFQMDGAISFIPLTHSHLFLQDAAACSSLDFALRFFDNDPDLNKWHLREIKTVAGGAGRAYGQARLFDESGKLVVEMTQQSILRPHKPRDAHI